MEYPSEHIKLIEELKTRNIIKSHSVARVMKDVDRGDFADMLPYTDCPAPIGYSSNISAPHMDAMCLELLKDHLVGKNRSLDIGSGSGYFTVLM